MTAWQLIISDWHWHPSVLLGCVGLLAGYAVLLRFRFGRAALWYASGVFVLFVALLSPLHTLGDTYLFSAHMLQHMLLILIVPPLLLLGLPAALVRTWLEIPPVRRIERVLRRPVVAWLFGMGTLWLWHVPALYNAALSNENLHIVEHLCFITTATIFWWPIVAPIDEARPMPLITVGYLFLAMIASGVLGIMLTFAAPGLYPAYLHPPDQLGILPLLRDTWGLTPAVDQQLGGLFMWVPSGLVYIAAAMVILARWYGTPETDDMPQASITSDGLPRAIDSRYVEEVS
ncbi:MAG TPA: cytochrome c oxidase assembly protein [Roseiflexaceae bacterium]|nr:cytochrome c oxidase assembly protein [Roseiflexaceae bacterium]